MRISQLIVALERLRDEQGDLVVAVWDIEDGLVEVLRAELHPEGRTYRPAQARPVVGHPQKIVEIR